MLVADSAAQLHSVYVGGCTAKAQATSQSAQPKHKVTVARERPDAAHMEE